MLQIHEAVAIIHHAYLDQVTDQGKNLAWDRFYHGLAPSLQDALEFVMTELLRGSKPVPVLTCCTLWLRRWRHISLCIHAGGSKGLPMPIKTSTGDTLLLRDR